MARSRLREVIQGSHIRISEFLHDEGFQRIQGGWEFSPRTTKEPDFPTVIVYKANSEERNGTIQATTPDGYLHKTHFSDYKGFLEAYDAIMNFLEVHAGEKGMK